MANNGHEKTSKVDPRVKRTRQLLQRAFRELLTEKSFDGVTVRDIAERAEVNRATFYAHFEDKYELLRCSVREALQTELDKRLPGAASLTLPNLRLLTVTIIDFTSRFMKGCRPGSNNTGYVHIAPYIQQHVNDLLLTWLAVPENGETKSSLYRVVTILGWIIFGAAIQSAQGNDRRSAEQIANDVLTFLMPSLQAYVVDIAEQTPQN